MRYIKIIVRNAFRHPLRTILTVLGLALTITAFGIVRNILFMFDLSRADILEGHLISRHKTSLMQYLPVAHKEKMEEVEGVKYVSYAHWVGVRYGDNAEDFFGKMAIDPEHYFDIRKDMSVSEDHLKEFQKNKTGCLITQGLALYMKWNIGDQVTIKSDYFENVEYKLTIVGILEFKQDEQQQAKFMMMRSDYFAEKLGQEVTSELDHSAGWFEILVDPPEDAGEVALRIDSVFANSPHETMTQTVDAFASSMYIDRFRTILTALQVSSFLMIVVILLVLLNTMSLVARERVSENAVLKTIGFRTSHLVFMNFGEALFVALLGGILGAFLIWPGLIMFKVALPMFQQMQYTFDILWWVIPVVLIVGLIASIVPIMRATRTTIVEGLRTVE